MPSSCLYHSSGLLVILSTVLAISNSNYAGQAKAMYSGSAALMYFNPGASGDRSPARPRTSSGRCARPTVHTAARNCTRDEGRPFGFGDQVADPKPPRAAAVKSRGGERRGNVGTMIPAGKVERGERKETASEASKAD